MNSTGAPSSLSRATHSSGGGEGGGPVGAGMLWGKGGQRDKLEGGAKLLQQGDALVWGRLGLEWKG